MSESVSIRRARGDDLDFLVSLVTHEDVAPFLAAVRPSSREELLAEVERSEAEPEASGVMVVEVDGRPAGTMAFERANKRSRIASLGGLAVHPDFRGRQLGHEAPGCSSATCSSSAASTGSSSRSTASTSARRGTRSARASSARASSARRTGATSSGWTASSTRLVAEDLEDETG